MSEIDENFLAEATTHVLWSFVNKLQKYLKFQKTTRESASGEDVDEEVFRGKVF